MKNGKIYILSGKVNSGKTTAISEWSKKIFNCGGILQPKINGKRFLVDIRTGEKKLLSVSDQTAKRDVISVGKYSFSYSAFDWAQKVLRKEMVNEPPWLIIDEYGKLELKGLGLEPVIGMLIDSISKSKRTDLIIVIREYLVDNFLKKYELPAQIINKENLQELI